LDRWRGGESGPPEADVIKLLIFVVGRFDCKTLKAMSMDKLNLIDKTKVEFSTLGVGN
jgi:hypothetical protein